jgi:hypothetical protein
MPYIKKEQRKEIVRRVDSGEESRYRYVSISKIKNSGELNYAITELMKDFIALNGLSYSTLNILVGVLECAKLELYRRVAAPYEDEKIKENGDVY